MTQKTIKKITKRKARKSPWPLVLLGARVGRDLGRRCLPGGTTA